MRNKVIVIVKVMRWTTAHADEAAEVRRQLDLCKLSLSISPGDVSNDSVCEPDTTATTVERTPVRDSRFVLVGNRSV